MNTKTTAKTDYFKLSVAEYRDIFEKEGKKPKLLLHVCCGACSCYPLVYLAGLFDITILFTNSNIYPEEEYTKRYLALEEYKNVIEKEFNVKIGLINDKYDHVNFVKKLIPYKDDKEGQTRCQICIKERLNRLFNYAQEKGYHYVATVMTVSRNKDGKYINNLGLELEKTHVNVKYFITDFKKNNGQDLGIELSKKYNVYRQNYCGCEFSKKN